MRSAGDTLLDLMAQAEREVLLAAPFVKLPALERTLTAIAADVSILCVTRWEPLEILAGVSDPGIWETLKDRPNSQLRLRMSLHGKLYRADQQCLVGSANLTGAALGWGPRTNLELLVPMPAGTEEIREYERQLLLGSVAVDQPIYSTTLNAVDALRRAGIAYPMPTAQDGTAQMRGTFETWLPTCRAPDRLYDAYHGRSDRMLTSAYQDALDDLRAINPPVGLDRNGFTAYVISKLEQHPVMRKLDEYVAVPRSSEEVSLYLSAQTALPPDVSAVEAAEVLKLWLLAFFPDRYRIRPPEGADVFVRGARIG